MFHTLTLDLPDPLFTHLQTQAKSTAHSLAEVVVEQLSRTLPSTEAELPPDLQAELNAMEQLSDHALWQLAESQANPDTVALYDLLLERLHAGSLTAAGRHWLEQLRNEAEALMLRKAHAYAILQKRGHQLPPLAALPPPSL